MNEFLHYGRLRDMFPDGFTKPDQPAQPSPAYFEVDYAEVERAVLGMNHLEISREFSVDDQFGIVRCQSCGGVASEHTPGAAFKYLDLEDCFCEPFLDPAIE